MPLNDKYYWEPKNKLTGKTKHLNIHIVEISNKLKAHFCPLKNVNVVIQVLKLMEVPTSA